MVSFRISRATMEIFYLAVAFILAATAIESAAVERPEIKCCLALLKDDVLSGKVLTPCNEDFQHRLESYYSANAAEPPRCMVLPQTAEDVARTIQIISARRCHFGMRSGAHSAFRGSNGLKDGITVDFGYMNSTEYDPTTGIASVRPGSNWEMYTPLWIRSVSRLLEDELLSSGLGVLPRAVGCYSFHSNRRGFACDNVVNFEVVLANGTIVNANAHENAGLWRALKGGSGNFGFVTRVDVEVVRSTQIWGGITTYDLSKTGDVVNAYVDFVNIMDEDPASQAIVTLLYGQQGLSLVAVLTNSDAKSSAPAFREFASIANVSSTARVGSVAEVVPEFTGPTRLGLYANWRTGMTSHGAAIMGFVLRTVPKYTERMKLAAPASNFELLTQFQPVTKSMVAHGDERGGNVLGLGRVVTGGPALMWLLALTVDTAENQVLILPLLLELERVINKYAGKEGLQEDWEFLNYSGFDQTPISHYGEETVHFMRNISLEYDPGRVFQDLRKTGFQIPVCVLNATNELDMDEPGF
ncbi:FAD binding domain-containing protein [Colletotrichum godetiae]|uniref:FAD binding domain-containing protein n=1 Tax=Colletotrichum godetiae TaxID=1209918 RepID=A0AAJ0AC53_9PEZI|nr:FAD binding domain-containing protein [Colletotrichum godetiae]KAK1659834.1 FAD binding domain-containing protein [Colletotrichum godetiae]